VAQRGHLPHRRRPWWRGPRTTASEKISRRFIGNPAKLAQTLEVLEAIQADFNASGAKKVSPADLIVLAGSTAVEKAAKDAGHDLTMMSQVREIPSSPFSRRLSPQEHPLKVPPRWPTSLRGWWCPESAPLQSPSTICPNPISSEPFSRRRVLNAKK
jgi:hypothetical protein